MPNVDHFADLPTDMQDALLDYIALNFKVQSGYNHRHSAYGLKQHFVSTQGFPDQHVTSECFSEAMVAAGFKRKRTDESEPNWYFNARVPNVLKP